MEALLPEPLNLVVAIPKMYAILISNPTTGKLLIGLRYDGSLEAGEGYVPDEAARLLWDAIARQGPYASKPRLVAGAEPSTTWEAAPRAD